MSTQFRQPRTSDLDEVRMKPPERRLHAREERGRRPIAWIVAMLLALGAILSVVVVEELRIADRDEQVTALRSQAQHQGAIISDMQWQVARLDATNARADRELARLRQRVGRTREALAERRAELLAHRTPASIARADAPGIQALLTSPLSARSAEA